MCGLTRLLVGKDGDFYGSTAAGGQYEHGVAFQLAPSGDGWTETVLYTFLDSQSDGAWPANLVQDSSGNLYGTSYWYYSGCGYLGWGYCSDAILFMLSPSNGNWTFTQVVHEHSGDGKYSFYQDSFHGLAIDVADNLYYAGRDVTYDPYQQTCDNYTSCYYYVRGPNGFGVNYVNQRFYAYGLVPDAQGKLYGVTQDCGKYNNGTVWQISP